jgi:hypothetical protein
MSAQQHGTFTNITIESTAPIIKTKQAAKQIHNQHVEVLVMGYSDRIMINITTQGKIGNLVTSSHYAT